MKTFKEWLKLREEDDDDKPSHSGTLKDVLNVSRDSLVGTSIPYSGKIGDKMYNLIPLIVKRFLPSSEEPTHVEVEIDTSENPSLALQVIWSKDDKEDEEPKKASPDSGPIFITIGDFDSALGQGWGPGMMGAGGGGGGMGMGLGGI
jgi:hypothetical protein